MHSVLIAAVEEVENALPIPPIGYAILALTTFVALLLVTFAFRSVGTRH
jgi:hypothetical protein